VTAARPPALILDEMSPPAIADALRQRGHDVLAIAADPQLRAMTDEQVCSWAAEHHRRIVTENAKDYRRLVVTFERSTAPTLLLTSNRTFPRSRRNFGRIIAALDAWLTAAARKDRPSEDWLQPALGSEWRRPQKVGEGPYSDTSTGQPASRARATAAS
jgi:hypothetical protein